RGALPPFGRLVPAFERRAEGDELEAVRAGDREPPRRGVDADEPARLQLDLLAVDAHRPGAADDEVDLLLAGLGVAVFPPVRTRRQREVVEAEGVCADRAPRLAHRAARTFARER